MALAATTVWECQTGGSDTLNGGAFDPGQTAGMFTDGAATSPATASPVFSSASYNFVAGDVGAWVYISSGTSSGGVVNSGSYKIASVAANAATLNATIGQGVLKTSFVPSTLTGVVTGTTLTAATWSIDYSQQAAAQFTYTDLASVGAGLLVSSAAKPFQKQQVGNSLIITGGTNFTPGTYVIASIGALNVATVVGPGNITTGAGVNGTGGQGGALLSPAIATGLKTAANSIWIKSGTYNVTTASTNVTNGCMSDTTNSTQTAHTLEGYGSIRGDVGTAPIILAGNAISSFTLFANPSGTASSQIVRNITFDGASLTTSRGISTTRQWTFDKVTIKNCTNDGINSSSTTYMYRCAVTGCGGTSGTNYGINMTSTAELFACEAYSNTVGGILLGGQGIAVNCLSYNNSGGSSDGFAGTQYVSCVAYNNGRDGFRSNAGNFSNLINCIAELNAGTGFNRSPSGFTGGVLLNCAAYSNTVSNVDTTSFPYRPGFVTGSGSFFTNAASGDFSLNNTAGAGASARAAGYPGVYPAGTTTGFLDIGAAQHTDPASGGGGMRLAGRGGLASGA